MRYREPFYHRSLKKHLRQISKPSAQRAYDSGKVVYALPANAIPDGLWVHMCPLQKCSEMPLSFTYMVNDYRYYSCCAELGRYPIFFIETTI